MVLGKVLKNKLIWFIKKFLQLQQILNHEFGRDQAQVARKI